jgi:hypothetical protein
VPLWRLGVKRPVTASGQRERGLGTLLSKASGGLTILGLPLGHGQRRRPVTAAPQRKDRNQKTPGTPSSESVRSNGSDTSGRSVQSKASQVSRNSGVFGVNKRDVVTDAKNALKALWQDSNGDKTSFERQIDNLSISDTNQIRSEDLKGIYKKSAHKQYLNKIYEVALNIKALHFNEKKPFTEQILNLDYDQLETLATQLRKFISSGNKKPTKFSHGGKRYEWAVAVGTYFLKEVKTEAQKRAAQAATNRNKGGIHNGISNQGKAGTKAHRYRYTESNSRSQTS